MAESPAHKFGQMIGNFFEQLIEPYLSTFASCNGLYLDHKNTPRGTRKGKKVAWKDTFGNVHDLDYVLERGGTNTEIGVPVAFIEVAWRRHTKHSRNKAQEIQGAILPLADKYRWSNPFLGVVLAGIFTEGSLDQLRSLGFNVLYFPYDTVVAAFASQNIDLAFCESTSDADFQKCVAKIEKSSPARMQRIKHHVCTANKLQMEDFMDSLKERLERMVERVLVIALYGLTNEFPTIHEALRFLNSHSSDQVFGEFRKYEILVRFTNGDKLEGEFQSKDKARNFLDFIARQ